MSGYDTDPLFLFPQGGKNLATPSLLGEGWEGGLSLCKRGINIKDI